MTIFDWMLLGPIDAMLVGASVIALRRSRQLRARRLAQARTPARTDVGRHRVGVAPGTAAQRNAAAAAARAVPWSISATARRAGRPPQPPRQPLVRPPVWVGAAV